MCVSFSKPDRTTRFSFEWTSFPKATLVLVVFRQLPGLRTRVGTLQFCQVNGPKNADDMVGTFKNHPSLRLHAQSRLYIALKKNKPIQTFREIVVSAETNTINRGLH
jgi:hypothetical protein